MSPRIRASLAAGILVIAGLAWGSSVSHHPQACPHSQPSLSRRTRDGSSPDRKLARGKLPDPDGRRVAAV